MNIASTFNVRSLMRLEAMLLTHPIAQAYFQGRLYDGYGKPLTELNIHHTEGPPLRLDAATTGRLCMIPDGSMVTATRIDDLSDAPAGVDIHYSNVFIQNGQHNSVVVYRSQSGPAMWIDAVYIRNIMLAPQAPARVTSIAFGLMAIAAYRLGFQHISLLAAGSGPLHETSEDDFIGYAIWPRFGFDAEVARVELDRFPHRTLTGAATVQDVRKNAPGWWEEHGSGRTMFFQLAANSRSWSILLNYLYTALMEDVP
ncbi:MAG: hypothetical protein ABW202_06245 [Duganella sp.]